MFRSGDMEIDHKSRGDRPVWCNVDRLSRLINVNGTTARIHTLCSNTVNLQIFGMVKKLEKWVPHASTEEQC
ncbi:hypothetical protein TNCT_243841 [Trichonephila clavata]|uniref:Uncharacterized protein n=1 Tax=Trichonephila clavata TaxID=2740835 RepID=A0A8X6GZV6_TRICU|nr:hypothetical protein TNCT_243841 [Trichonephila clavata]